MARRESEGVRAALEAEAQPIVVGRVRAILCLGIVTIPLSMGVDLYMRPPGLARLAVLKVVATAAYAAAALLLGALRRARWDRAIGTATVGISVICLVNAAIGTVTGDVLMAAYVLTVV